MAEVLTSKQREEIKQLADDTVSWRDEDDLKRRRSVGREVRNAITRSGLLEGKTIDHRHLCEMVGLQWQIQNLNPMQMPKFLGLYAYKVHFAGFQGTREDLAAQRKKETGDEGFYPGADLAIVSKAVRLIASESQEDQGLGTSMLLSVDGAGQALVSGFLHLLHADKYGLVNTTFLSSTRSTAATSHASLVSCCSCWNVAKRRRTCRIQRSHFPFRQTLLYSGQ
jgi:hypothetical protein